MLKFGDAVLKDGDKWLKEGKFVTFNYTNGTYGHGYAWTSGPAKALRGETVTFNVTVEGDAWDGHMSLLYRRSPTDSINDSYQVTDNITGTTWTVPEDVYPLTVQVYPYWM